MNKGKDAFDTEVLIKHKYLRSNQILFMNKELLKAIKNRTKLRNRTRCIGDKEAYNKQQDYCVSLIWKTKQQQTTLTTLIIGTLPIKSLTVIK